MGLFIDHPKQMDRNMGIVVLILNILPIPGVGTVIYNVSTGDDKWVNAIVPIVLSLTMVLWILGLVWAVIDGVKIFQASRPAAA